jgi:3-methyladenine DNA glycosylase/8-oxoguanine DNA glycosylase
MNSDPTPQAFSCKPSGPFDLANQNSHFGGWPTPSGSPEAIVMAFALEGVEHSGAVVIREPRDGLISGEVHGCEGSLAEAAWRQALATISLDLNGSGWDAVGKRDRVIGRLQVRYRHLRPTLFHSPYEAAAAFMIGHRISIRQARAMRARLATELGTAIGVAGETFHAFPTPGLLAADALPGINETKAVRLRAIAGAAQDGWLSREALRSMEEVDALGKLQTLPGIGAFFSKGILHRGAGTVDALLDDEITRVAIEQAYGAKTAVPRTLEQIAVEWRPYRTWTGVLLHLWARSELHLPGQRDGRRPRRSPERTATA